MDNPNPAKTEPFFSRQVLTRFLMIVFALSAPLGHATTGLGLFFLAFPLIYWQYKKEDPSFSFFGQLLPPLVALILASYLSALFGTHPQKALPFTTGLVLMAVTGIAAGRVYVKDKKFFFTFAMPLSLAAIGLSVFVAIGQYFFFDPGSRATAFTGHPNRLGTLFLIFVLLGMAFIFDRAKKYQWLVIPYAVLILLGLGTTLSRAAWLGTAGGFVLFFLHSFQKNSNKKLLFFILIISVLAWGLFFLHPQWYQRFLSISDLQNNIIRINLWKAAGRIFQDRPLTGTGLGNFPEVVLDYAGDLLKKTQATPHNIFWSILSDLGLVGLAAFFWFMWKAAAMAFLLWRHGDLFEAGVVITLAALFINELFTHNLYTSQIGAIIWFLLGALSMLAEERKPRPVPGDKN